MPRKFLGSARHAWCGLRANLRRGRNAKIQLVIAAMAVGTGVWCGFRAWEWVAVILCIGLVVAAELFNTALEILADEISLEQRPGLGMAKDIAAGAVLVCAGTTVVVAAVIAWGRLTN